MPTYPLIYYINLDYRIDRKNEMLDWLEDANTPTERIVRVSAVHCPGRGHLGCLLSHIKTLTHFLQGSEPYCIVLEDDYQPLHPTTFWDSIQKVFTQNVNFDLIMLATNLPKSEPTEYDFLHRLQASFTSSGYIITREFAPTVLQNFKEAVMKLDEQEQRTHQKANEFCLDVYWQRLMPISRWFCFYPIIGIQRESYSDIEQVHANHTK